MTLTEYLIEAIARRKTGKYKPKEDFDIRNSEFDYTTDYLEENEWCIKEIKGSDAEDINKLVDTGRYDDAKRIILNNIGENDEFCWMRRIVGGRKSNQVLFFYYIPRGGTEINIVQIKVLYGSSALPSPTTIHTDFRTHKTESTLKMSNIDYDTIDETITRLTQ